MLDSYADPGSADWGAVATCLGAAWQNGYLGHGSVAEWQTHNETLLGAFLLQPTVKLAPFRWFLDWTGYNWQGQREEDPLPPNVTVATRLKTPIGGHAGVGWSFLPWPASDVRDLADETKLTTYARAGIEDGYRGVLQSLRSLPEGDRYWICVYHRGGPRPGPFGVPEWATVVTDCYTRPGPLAALRVRLPGHKRRLVARGV